MIDANVDRYVAGETLKDGAAQEMLDELRDHPWRFWIQLARGYIRARQPEQAEHILEQLIKWGELAIPAEEISKP